MRTAQYTFAKGAALYEERTSLPQRFICFFGRFSALHGAVIYKSAYFIHKIHRRRHLQGAKSVRFCTAAQFFSKTQIKNGQVINIMGRFLLFSDMGRRKNTRARPFEERIIKKTALRAAIRINTPEKSGCRPPASRKDGSGDVFIPSDPPAGRVFNPSGCFLPPFPGKREGQGKPDTARDKPHIKGVLPYQHEKTAFDGTQTRSAHNHLPSAM